MDIHVLQAEELQDRVTRIAAESCERQISVGVTLDRIRFLGRQPEIDHYCETLKNIEK